MPLLGKEAVGWCPRRLGLEEPDDGSGGGACLFSSTSWHSAAGCAGRTHSPWGSSCGLSRHRRYLLVFTKRSGGLGANPTAKAGRKASWGLVGETPSRKGQRGLQGLPLLMARPLNVQVKL